jgi:hypothetical protein
MLGLALSGSGQSARIGSQVSDGRVSTNQGRLKITASLAEQTYCSASNLRLTIHLTITNIGDEPLILDRDYFAIIHTSITGSELAGQGPRKFEFNNQIIMQFFKMNDSRPDAKLFITLKPKEAFVTSIHDYIPAHDGDKTHGEFLKPGIYVHQSVLLPWGGRSRLGDELQKKWKQYGFLWVEPLTTEPIQFSVDRSPTIGDCGKD